MPSTSAALSIVDTTRSYETWLMRQTRIVQADLDLKHQRMADDPFLFFRATFYHWLHVWRDACGLSHLGPSVTAVGDIHVENFGTWRDSEGRLVWGVNDLDEGCELPYVHDLIRLATSAHFALRAGQFDIGLKTMCDAIVEGYAASVDAGGRPLVLAERHRWLREIAIEEIKKPVEFWERLLRPSTTRSKDGAAALAGAFPRGTEHVKISRRVAGLGSLGRPRYVGIGMLGGTAIAREAKARVPSAAVWLGAADRPASTLFKDATRLADPLLTHHGGWIVRRLAPDCIKLDMSALPRERDERKLLEAMGWELANLHVRRKNRTAILDDLFSRPRGWLRETARTMTDVMRRDWRAWRRHVRR